MRAVDTNVLVRLATRDNARQTGPRSPLGTFDRNLAKLAGTHKL